MDHCRPKTSANILGIDIGPNSIGWALIECNKKLKPNKITAAGVRIFPAGLDDLERDGKGKSRNTQRREARSRRRQTERTARRMLNLARALQKNGLLPEGELNNSQQRHLFLENLDQELESPYKLRAKGLDQKLNPYEFGRSLYHLAQRRGFLTNRKTPIKDEKEEKGIKAEISGLSKEIADSNARTLGEYLASIASKDVRIRQRYTSRKMYETEFELLWTKQAEYYPQILTDTLKKDIHKIIFHQRPLKSVKKFIGGCELEKGRKRAPWGLLIAQRYRYLQRLNDLKILEGMNGTERELNDDERVILATELEHKKEVSFAAMRRLLKLKKGTKFNLELGGEKKIPGNKTTAKLIDIFGLDRWRGFGDHERNSIVEDLRSIRKEETLKKRWIKEWGLDDDKAQAFSKIRLEDGYCRFSRQALDRLVPLLENGFSLQTAIKECYPAFFERTEAKFDLLPIVRAEVLPDLRNPIVERALTELRRVVNAIIVRYGLPERINIEFARELRQSAKQREQTSKKMRANQRTRESAAKKIIEETEIPDPGRTDILKVQLAEECDWICPYTGSPITPQSLLGDHPQFDIEHIIPLNRSLDDSFMNKTLCWAIENRDVKRNRTPFETYYGTPQWDEIIARVKKFKGGTAYAKLRRFQMKPDEVDKSLADFTARQLNDTRWASKWAKKYLGLLYGGIDSDGIDVTGKRRVNTVTGQVTAFFRNEWGLNAVLGDGPGKSRDDHRHHAVDALIVALMTAANVKMLSDAAGRAMRTGRRKFEGVETPWGGFAGEAKSIIRNVTVSHRLSKRVRGALHKETFYGRPRKDEKGKDYVHLRVGLDEISEKNIANIIDPAVRQAVRTKLKEKGSSPKDVFKDVANHPCLKKPNGDGITIHRVRIRENLSPFMVGNGDGARYVKNDSIHHMEVFETTNKKGEVKWGAEVVSMFDAYARKNADGPIINRDFGKKRKFLFSLAGHEIIELDDVDGKRSLFVIRSIEKSNGKVRFVPINDARTLNDIGKAGFTALPEPLRKRNCRKVVVTPLGEIRRAND